MESSDEWNKALVVQASNSAGSYYGRVVKGSRFWVCYAFIPPASSLFYSEIITFYAKHETNPKV
jgi:hypothetical protein